LSKEFCKVSPDEVVSVFNIKLAQQEWQGPPRILNVENSENGIIILLPTAIEALQLSKVAYLLCRNLADAFLGRVCIEVGASARRMMTEIPDSRPRNKRKGTDPVSRNQLPERVRHMCRARNSPCATSGHGSASTGDVLHPETPRVSVQVSLLNFVEVK
jgi:hypothetical protein